MIEYTISVLNLDGSLRGTYTIEDFGKYDSSRALSVFFYQYPHYRSNNFLVQIDKAREI